MFDLWKFEHRTNALDRDLDYSCFQIRINQTRKPLLPKNTKRFCTVKAPLFDRCWSNQRTCWTTVKLCQLAAGSFKSGIKPSWSHRTVLRWGCLPSPALAGLVTVCSTSRYDLRAVLLRRARIILIHPGGIESDRPFIFLYFYHPDKAFERTRDWNQFWAGRVPTNFHQIDVTVLSCRTSFFDVSRKK